METLRPLISREGSLTANRSANSLVVADYADNIRRIRDLIRQIDRDSAATQIVTLDNAGAREIATALQESAHPILVLNPEDDLWPYTPRVAPLLKNGRVHDLTGWTHGFLDAETAKVGIILRNFLDH